MKSICPCTTSALCTLLSVSAGVCVRWGQSRGLHNCSNGYTSEWSISLISCQPSAICFCAAKDECSWSQESGLNIWATCWGINAVFPPLCCSSQTDVCRHFPSTLPRECFFTGRPLLVIQVNTAHSDFLCCDCYVSASMLLLYGRRTWQKHFPFVTALLQPATWVIMVPIECVGCWCGVYV